MKKVSYVIIGILIGGVLLNGNITDAAAGLLAERSNQSVYVDGQRVELEAYNIDGSNYVKLRDAGKAVGFNVYWDGSAVHVQSDAPYTGEAPASAASAPAQETGSRIVTLPTDGSKYVPQPGDVIRCDDGTLYTIKDTQRFENNVFAPGPLPDLPTPTCDWSLFPTLELPAVECRHFANSGGKDVLFVRNLYELRRMTYTLYNSIGQQPEAWRDGKPLAKVIYTIPAEYEPYTGHFWPWRESELTKQVVNLPCGRFWIDTFDFYSDGVFQYTRYLICTI